MEALRSKARRRFTIQWARDANLAVTTPPPFLEIKERRDRTWEGELRGPVPEFLRWAHAQPLEDMALGHPDLDSLFRSYYRKEGGAP